MLRVGGGRFAFVGDVAGTGTPIELPQSLHGRTFIANFEGVPASVLEHYRPAPKCGPHLITEHVQLSRPTIWSLANNHSADWGPEALLQLRNYLLQMGDAPVGAGTHTSDARSPLVIQTPSGSSIGLLAICERQYGGATATSAGTSEVGPWVFSEIQRLRQIVDFVVVSIHRGPENSPLPSPNQQDLYRAFIDSGANLVHGHHSHVPQGVESYGGGKIFYGLGNFLVNSETWASRHMAFVSVAILLDEDLALSERFRVSSVVLEQQNLPASRRIEVDEGAYAEYFAAASSILLDREFFEACYQEVAIRLFSDHLYKYTQQPQAYFKRSTGRMRVPIRSAVRHRSNKLNERHLALLHHSFSCPTHAEAIEAASGVLSGRVRDRRSSRSREVVDFLNYFSSSWLAE